jgi:hypothetical protein
VRGREDKDSYGCGTRRAATVACGWIVSECEERKNASGQKC